MDYTAVIEKGRENYGGYVLDIDGIYAVGASEQDVIEKLAEAITCRITELRAEGKEVPLPSQKAVTVHIAA
jgi:predicted RNase H-like HicB family nuclease